MRDRARAGGDEGISAARAPGPMDWRAIPDASLIVVVAAVEPASGIIVAAEVVTPAPQIVAAVITRVDRGECRDESLECRLAAMRAGRVGRREARQQGRRALATLLAAVLVDGHPYDYRDDWARPHSGRRRPSASVRTKDAAGASRWRAPEARMPTADWQLQGAGLLRGRHGAAGGQAQPRPDHRQRRQRGSGMRLRRAFAWSFLPSRDVRHGSSNQDRRRQAVGRDARAHAATCPPRLALKPGLGIRTRGLHPPVCRRGRDGGPWWTWAGAGRGRPRP